MPWPWYAPCLAFPPRSQILCKTRHPEFQELYTSAGRFEESLMSSLCLGVRLVLMPVFVLEGLFCGHELFVQEMQLGFDLS